MDIWPKLEANIQSLDSRALNFDWLYAVSTALLLLHSSILICQVAALGILLCGFGLEIRH
jgi:hypothetical protein